MTGMSDDTWEERMSQRAKARQGAREAVEDEAWAEWARHENAIWEETLPSLPGEERVLHDWTPGHVGHLEHWCLISRMCSCGMRGASGSFAISDDYKPEPCETCRTRQIGAFVRRG